MQDMDWAQVIAEAVRPGNETERQRRIAHYAYLVESGQVGGETLEQYLERYASYAKSAAPATEAAIDSLRQLSPTLLPDDLVGFYRSAGGFYGKACFWGAEIPSPDDLLAFHRSGRRDEKIESLGLVDMIRHTWGNDRGEFEANSSHGLTGDEIRTLNARFAVAGWRIPEEGEAFEYMFFDASGQFDLLYYHQDAFEELYEQALAPMLAGKSASLTFPEVFSRWLLQQVDPWDDCEQVDPWDND